MYRQLIFVFLLLAIEKFNFVRCYVPGSRIWSHNHQSFIPVANVTTFKAYQQENLDKSRAEELHNFQGEVLKFGYFQVKDIVHFYDNDTKVTGLQGDLWNTLAKHSNFTLVAIKVDGYSSPRNRGTNNSVIKMMLERGIQIIPRITLKKQYLEWAEFITPIRASSYSVYIQPIWKFNNNWIANMCSYNVWCAILLLLILLAGLGYSMESISIRVSGDKIHRHDFHDHLLYTFSAFCSQGFIPDAVDGRTRILGLSKMLFGWLLLAICGAHLISYITSRKHHPPFEDIRSLVKNTRYSIAMDKSSTAFPLYLELLASLREENPEKNLTDRFQYKWSRHSLYTDACNCDIESAIFEETGNVEIYGGRFCELVPTGKTYFPIWVGSAVTRGLEHKRTLDIGTLKMREFGLIPRLIRHWVLVNKSPTDVVRQRPSEPVTLHQVIVLFLILSIGIAASVIVLVLEFIVFLYTNHRRIFSSKRQ